MFAQKCVTLCDPMDVACQNLLSTELPRQEYWSGLPFSPPGDLPDPGIEPHLLCLPCRQADSIPGTTWQCAKTLFQMSHGHRFRVDASHQGHHLTQHGLPRRVQVACGPELAQAKGLSREGAPVLPAVAGGPLGLVPVHLYHVAEEGTQAQLRGCATALPPTVI